MATFALRKKPIPSIFAFSIHHPIVEYSQLQGRRSHISIGHVETVLTVIVVAKLVMLKPNQHDRLLLP